MAMFRIILPFHRKKFTCKPTYNSIHFIPNFGGMFTK